MSHYTTDLPFTAYNFRCYKRQSFYVYHRNPLHQLYPQFWLITGNTTQHLTIQSIVQHIYTKFITISPVYFIFRSSRHSTVFILILLSTDSVQLHNYIASIVNFINSITLSSNFVCPLSAFKTIDQVLSTNMLLLQHLLQYRLPLPTWISFISAAGTFPVLESTSLQCCYCSSICYNYLLSLPTSRLQPSRLQELEKSSIQIDGLEHCYWPSICRKAYCRCQSRSLLSRPPKIVPSSGYLHPSAATAPESVEQPAVSFNVVVPAVSTSGSVQHIILSRTSRAVNAPA